MNNRLEIFCDGVFAIAITLLILDIKVPPLEKMNSVADVWRYVISLWPSFFALAFSFAIIFISWLGHHNLMSIIDKASARFQVANGFFLLTVIIMPWPTAFMAEYLNTPYAQPAIVTFCLSALLHNLGWNVLLRYAMYPVPLVKEFVGTAPLKKIRKDNKFGGFILLTLTIAAWWLPHVALVISLFLWAYWLYISVALKKKHSG